MHALENWELSPEENADAICDFVRQHGVAVLKRYVVDEEMLSNVRQEALIATASSKHNYKFGRIIRYSGAPPLPNAKKMLNDPKSKHVLQMLNVEIKETFISHEFLHGEIERNGYLHFDRLHAYKLFYYLTDVDINCGPLRIIMDSHELGRKLRQLEWSKNQAYADVKNRIALDHPQFGYNEDDGSPVLGPAGTLIVFDTDSLHKGGLVAPGYERLILRTHNR